MLLSQSNCNKRGRLLHALGLACALSPVAVLAGTANQWIAPISGNWATPGNWSLGVVPDNGVGGPTYDAIINPGSPQHTVTVNGSYTVDNLTVGSNSSLRLLDGTLTLAGANPLSGAKVSIDSQTKASTLRLLGNHTLDGASEYVFDGNPTANARIDVEGGTMTLGSQVVVRSGSAGGWVGNHSSATNTGLVNQGKISAQTPGTTVSVSAASVSSLGWLEAINGATLVANNLTGNLGTVVVEPGSRMELVGLPLVGFTNNIPRVFNADVSLGGKWTNTAPIQVSGGRLTLAGAGNNTSTITAIDSQVVFGGSTAIGTATPDVGIMSLTNSTLLISGKVAPSQIDQVSFVNTPVTVTGVIERAPGSTVPVTLTGGSGDWIIKGANLNATFNTTDGTGLLVAAWPRDAIFENAEINAPLTIEAGAILRGSPTLNGRLKNAGMIIMPRFSGGTLNLAPGSENTGFIVLDSATPTATGAGIKNDGSIRLSSNSQFQFQSGKLSGVGVVEVEAGSVLALVEGGRQNRLAIGGLVRLGTQFGVGGRLTVKEFLINGLPGNWAGKLDLGGGALAIDYDPQNGSPLATVTDQLKFARGPTGAWNGPGGITSSRAASSSTSTIGYAEAADVLGLSGNQTATWRGDEVDATSLLIGYVKRGDANMDGKVAFEDLVAVAQNYDGPAGTGVWWHGDFNYDAKVDFGDLVILAQNYGAVASPPVAAFDPAFAADVERAFTSVPEPGAVLVTAAAMGLLGRGRTRGRIALPA